MKTKLFDVKLTDIENQVHDGDTIEHVYIHLCEVSGSGEGQIWPDLYQKDGVLFAVFNLRLAGIDTPEMHPHTHTPDGKERSQASRDAEKAAALEAKQALIDLLKRSSWVGISYPRDGKYAGRIVADLWVDTDGQRLSVATYMIENNYAKPYDGGTKTEWEF